MLHLARWPSRRFVWRASVVASAVLAAVGVWIVAALLLNVDLTVRAFTARAGSPGLTTRNIAPDDVIAVPSGVGLGGWAALACLEHLTRHAAAVWLATALPAVILSLAGPFTATTVSALISLSCMHLAVAAVLIPGLILEPGLVDAS